MHARFKPKNQISPRKAFRSEISHDVELAETSWITVRCIQLDARRRVRFAHTAPGHIDLANKPILPYRPEIELLIRRVRDEIELNKDVLPAEALKEYRAALEIYKAIAKRARPKKRR